MAKRRVSEHRWESSIAIGRLSGQTKFTGWHGQTYWAGPSIDDPLEGQSIRNAIWTAGAGRDRVRGGALLRLEGGTRRCDVGGTPIGQRVNHVCEEGSSCERCSLYWRYGSRMPDEMLESSQETLQAQQVVAPKGGAARRQRRQRHRSRAQRTGSTLSLRKEKRPVLA
jgi:hypothetical protein